jgi:hypothetical protein
MLGRTRPLAKSTLFNLEPVTSIGLIPASLEIEIANATFFEELTMIISMLSSERIFSSLPQA